MKNGKKKTMLAESPLRSFEKKGETTVYLAGREIIVPSWRKGLFTSAELQLRCTPAKVARAMSDV